MLIEYYNDLGCLVTGSASLVLSDEMRVEVNRLSESKQAEINNWLKDVNMKVEIQVRKTYQSKPDEERSFLDVLARMHEILEEAKDGNGIRKH